MDRTQYGKVTVADTYRPFDLAMKKKPLPGYALLADLQTNLNKPSPLNHTNTQQTTVITNNQPTTRTEITKTVITNHHNDRINGDVYQNEEERKSNHRPGNHVQNGYHISTTSPTYQNVPSKAEQMFRHEVREEVRTETHSSGPEPSPTKKNISNNLSELDTLLHDLNTTKQNSFNKDSTVVNGTRPSVDSLLDELNSVGHRESTYEKHTTHQETRPVSYTNKVTHVSASNATKELDDLMESLSDFKGSESKTTMKTETKKSSEETKNQVQTRLEEEIRTLGLLTDDAPPRPPLPFQHAPPSQPPPPEPELQAIPLPPPRPPAPVEPYTPTPDISIPAVLPAPLMPSPATVSIIYTQPDQPQHRPPDALVMDGPFNRPESGGPVKRNDAEYRWVTDPIKHEVREIVEYPTPPTVDVEDKLKVRRINASSLQSQVENTAYAKPIPKRRSPSPPPPPKPVTPPAPKPSPPNQLDSMLGTLTSHMTEQGINTSQKGCCVACDKPIVGQVITALGKTWHPEHFTCTHCKEELGTKNFFERDGKPYCEPDYHNLFSPKCAYCNGPILDKCVTAMNKTWHPEHFFCAQCGNPFGEGGFHEKNGKPYCREDYFNMFAPKCGGCNNPITENYISALNGQWHPECFVCRDCKQSVASKAFYEMEGKAVCGECLGIEDDGEEEEEEEA